MKFISYNLNGIRSASKKGFLEWLGSEQPDIVCLQEVRAEMHEAPIEAIEQIGYQVHWLSATSKKGYSGVAILTKDSPIRVSVGSGNERFDAEGRVIRADFEDFTLINAYFPSGTSGQERQAVKYEWLADFEVYIDRVKKEQNHLVICGDFNIAHEPIDIHNPISNKKSSGFLPEERAWLSRFLESGFIDSFRILNPDSQRYSWWSSRANAKAKNLGWRIDYFVVSSAMSTRLRQADILESVQFSDHAPIMMSLL